MFGIQRWWYVKRLRNEANFLIKKQKEGVDISIQASKFQVKLGKYGGNDVKLASKILSDEVFSGFVNDAVTSHITGPHLALALDGSSLMLSQMKC